MTVGGIVVCGGESRRMGRAKAMLPLGPELMLQRVVRLLAEAVGPVVVGAAQGQELPELPTGVRVLRDRQPGRGPLEGLAVGLNALADQVELAFATACDTPFLRPAYVRRLVELATGYDVVVPQVRGFDEPLSAIYRTDLGPRLEALLAADRLRPVFLFDLVRTRRVAAEELADVDPGMESLLNLNHPDDYQAALARLGFSS